MTSQPTEPVTCLNCGGVYKGNYCSNCGQKNIDKNDRSLGTFFTYAFNEYFNWDSKFFRSVKDVLFKPGFLTNEYSKGRLASYISPLKLYLCMSLVSFLIITNVDSDEYTNLELGKTDTENIFANWVTEIRKDKNISEEAFKDRFNSELNDKLSLYMLVMVFIFSFPLKIIEHKRFYVEHLSFSFHFFTFALFCLTIDTLISKINNDTTWFLSFLIPFAYLLIAFRKVYKRNWIVTIIETGIFSIYYTILLSALVISAIFISALMA
jgi:hypothetical protein